MGYTFQCDGPCGEGYNTAPPFMGEFRETFLKTSPSPLVQMFRPGQTVTMCRECSELVFASGVIAFCRRCGFAANLEDLPASVSKSCPQCEDNDLSFRPVGESDGV